MIFRINKMSALSCDRYNDLNGHSPKVREGASTSMGLLSKQGFQQYAALGLLCAGLALLIGWQLMMFRSVTPYIRSFAGPEAVLDHAYLLVGLAQLLYLLIIARNSAPFALLLDKRWAPFAAAALMGIGTVVLGLSGSKPETLLPLCILGGIIAGGGSIFLLLAFGKQYSKLPIGTCLTTSAIAFISAVVLFLLFGMLVLTPALVCSTTCAVLSGIALGLHGTFGQIKCGKDEAQRPIRVIAAQPVSDRRLIAKFAILIAIWGGVTEFLRTFYVQSGVNEIGNTGFVAMLGLGALIVAVLATLVIFGLAIFPKRFTLSLAYRAVLLLSLMGILVLPTSWDGDMGIFPYSLTTGSYMLLWMLAWMLSIALTSRRDENPAATLSAIWATWTAGTLVGFFLARTLFGPVHEELNALVITTAALACLLVMSYLSVFTESDVDAMAQLFPSRREDRFLERCQTVGNQHGLSGREQEVMVFLAKGRNANFISKTLFISYNTVTTHRKHIYQKLGIHSQQELLDLLDHEKKAS